MTFMINTNLYLFRGLSPNKYNRYWKYQTNDITNESQLSGLATSLVKSKVT